MKNIQRGQVWTIKTEKTDQTFSSMLVLTVKKIDSSWLVVPVHENLGLKTHLDINLNLYSEKFEEFFEVCTIIHMNTRIPEVAFSNEKAYLGSVTKEDSDNINKQISQYHLAISKLSEIQMKQSIDPDFVEDENDLSSITSGIYELCAVQTCSLEELIEFNDEYCQPLYYWQEQFICMENQEEFEPVSTSLYQKVASVIKLFFNNEPLADYFPIAAGEASKADHKVSRKTEISGKKLEFEIVIDWNDTEKATEIRIVGKSATFLRNKNLKITVFFSDGKKTVFDYDNEKNFVLKIPYRKSSIESIQLNI